MRNGIALVLGEPRHARAFGDVLADESIGILVAAPLPGVMRGRKVEGNAGLTLDLLVGVELSAVVGSDGLEPSGVLGNEPNGAFIQFFFGAGPELADQHVAGSSLDQGHNTVAGTGTDDGVDLPVTPPASASSRCGTFGDVTLSGEFPAAVIAAVALAPLLAGTAQFPVEHTAFGPIAPDIAIDGLMADRERTAQPQITRDLFRTPLLLEQPYHQTKIPAAKLLVSARPGSPGAGAAGCLARAVVAIVAAVALKFPANRASVSPQVEGNLGLIESLLSQGRNNISFF